MVNVNRWIYNFNSLGPENQLKVADAIIGELRDNESTFDTSEYDREKSKLVREAFETFISIAALNEELKSNIELFEGFDSLSEDNKNKVINEIFKIIKKYLEIQEQENKKMMCEQEARHIFSEWKKATLFTEEPVWDAGLRGHVKVEHENWKRTCSRCGFVETVDKEPAELVAARKEKNKKRRIKQLKAELRRLENESE